MKTTLHYLLGIALVVVLLHPTWARATPLTIGYLSLDSGGVNGENSFDLYNFTGGLLTPGPDAISDDLLFSGTLSLNEAGTLVTYTFSGADVDGGTPTTIVSLLPSVGLLSATLSLTLSNSVGVAIYDDSGNLTIANLQGVADTTLLAPLVPCDNSGSPCSNATIAVALTPSGGPAPTPEPSSWILLGTGLMGGMGLACKHRLRPS